MRVLAITKLYPPEGSARALQAGKLIAALRHIGMDIKLVSGLPARAASTPGPVVPTVRVPFRDDRFSNGWLARIMRVLRESGSVAVTSPWATAAAGAALRVSAEWKPDVVLSLSTPFDSHRAASVVSKRLSTPWVAFFSDPYPLGLLGHPYTDAELAPLTWLQSIEAGRVLRNVSAIVAPTMETANLVARRLRRSAPPLLLEVPHIAGAVCPEPAGCSIVHVGDITRQRAGKPVLQGLADAACRLSGEGARLLFVGRTDPRFRQDLLQLMNGSTAPEFVDRVGPDLALSHVARARVLLIVEADAPGSPFVPSKLADYMASGRPIVAITPPGSALRRFAAGFKGVFFARHDAAEVAKAVLAAWPLQLPIERSDTERFSGNSVAALFASLFTQVLSGERSADA